MSYPTKAGTTKIRKASTPPKIECQPPFSEAIRDILFRRYLRQTMTNGIEHCLGPRSNSQLCIDRADVILHRAFCDHQFARDGSVIQAAGEQTQRLDLARGQRLQDFRALHSGTRERAAR